MPQPVEVLATDVRRARFLGYVSELSDTGLFVQSTNPREIGSRLDLRVRLPGRSSPPICAQGEVIWTRGYQGVNAPSAGMGIRFLALDGSARQLLQQFCQGSEGETGPSDCP